MQRKRTEKTIATRDRKRLCVRYTVKLEKTILFTEIRKYIGGKKIVGGHTESQRREKSMTTVLTRWKDHLIVVAYSSAVVAYSKLDKKYRKESM